MLAFLCLKNLGYYLAKTEIKHGQYLVVEGWLDEKNLDQALQVFRSTDNQYQYLITTGGPEHYKQHTLSYAEKSANYFISQGLSAEKIIVISTPASAQARTFLSAVMVHDWLSKNGIKDRVIDVFTDSVHARRTHFLYKKSFRSVDNMGIYASSPSNFQLATWWKTSEGAKTVITEMLGLVWVICFFEPAEPGSQQEKWG